MWLELVPRAKGGLWGQLPQQVLIRHSSCCHCCREHLPWAPEPAVATVPTALRQSPGPNRRTLVGHRLLRPSPCKVKEAGASTDQGHGLWPLATWEPCSTPKGPGILRLCMTAGLLAPFGQMSIENLPTASPPPGSPQALSLFPAAPSRL